MNRRNLQLVEFDNLIRQLGLLALDGMAYKKLLGAGGQAPVCLYEDPEGNQVAVKLLVGPRDQATLRRFEDECEALKRCRQLGDTVVGAQSEVRQVPGLPIRYFLMDVARG